MKRGNDLDLTTPLFISEFLFIYLVQLMHRLNPTPAEKTKKKVH